VKSFVDPHEKVAMEVNLFEGHLVEEAAELAHLLHVQATIILVLGSLYHVEVPDEELGTILDLTRIVKLRQEVWFALLRGRAIDQ
jgi:hypothetical protein